MTKYITILGTLDTKGQEVAFLREAVRADGGGPLVVDIGALGTPTSPADVSPQRVTEAAGSRQQMRSGTTLRTSASCPKTWKEREAGQGS